MVTQIPPAPAGEGNCHLLSEKQENTWKRQLFQRDRVREGCQKSRKMPGEGNFSKGNEEWGKVENWKQEKGAEDSSNNSINVVKMLICHPQSEEVPWLGGWKSYRFHKIQPGLIPWHCCVPGIHFYSIYSHLFPRQFLPFPAPPKGTLHKAFGRAQVKLLQALHPHPKIPQHTQGTPQYSWNTLQTLQGNAGAQ